MPTHAPAEQWSALVHALPSPHGSASLFEYWAVEMPGWQDWHAFPGLTVPLATQVLPILQ